MKSTHKTHGFDYSKYKSKVSEASDLETYDYQFWGLHPKHGRIHVDTKRYFKMLLDINATEYLNEGMKANRNTNYLIPSKVHRYDYKINIFRDLIYSLKTDWNEEYKPIFDKIKSPSDVYDQVRTSELMFTSDSDDFDQIDEDAMFASLRRTRTYNRIINSLYCQFVQKIATEIERYILLVSIEGGYKSNDFHMGKFLTFCDGLRKNKDYFKFEDLKCYASFDKLRKINIFLKHNSLVSYKKLKSNYPECVACIENKTSKIKYENGMFAGDWIIFEKNYIDNLLNDILTFFEDYCLVYYQEDLKRSEWDYDDFFIESFENVKDQERYFKEKYGI